MKGIREGSSDREFYYNNLFYDYLFEFGNLEQFYCFDHRLADSYRKRAEEVARNYNHSLRKKLSEILAAHNQSLGCGKETISNIEKLGDRGSLVVIGGQQPLLFGGPLFLTYKAITVIRMAEYLQNQLNVNVVPCFWNASDDSNTGQINSISVFSGENIEDVVMGDLKEGIRFSDLSVSRGQAMQVLSKLKDKLAPTDFREKITGFLNSCIREASQGDGLTAADLFSSVLLKLFSARGLVIIDPALEGIKSLGWEVIKSDIEDFGAVNAMVESAGRRLEKAGYHAQIKSSPDTLNFFFASGGKRNRITYRNKSFRLSGRNYSPDLLADMARENIGALCPNVVLRPLLQDTVFPVLATVCGPGEVSYFAQLKDVYHHRGKKLPVIYPRFSATLVEKKVKKVLEKYQLDYGMLSKSTGEVEKMVLKKFLDFDIERIVSELNHDIINRIEKARQEIFSNLMDVSSSFDRIKRNLSKETGVLKNKLFSEYRKQNRHISEGVYKLKLNLLPDGNLQERRISLFNYLNKYDFKLLDRLYDSFEPFDYTHKFLEVK
ncbi:MAG: bacillithiol biosynthesis cysteine-adding enzyme BshC [Actinomycetota bacterium]